MEQVEWVYSHYEQAMKEWRQQVAKTDATTDATTDVTIKESIQQRPLEGAPPPVEFNADSFDPFVAAPGQTVLPDDFVIPFDTSNVQSNSLPVGNYKGRVINLRPGTKSAKGNDCWIWTFQVTEGEFATKTIDHYTYGGGGAFKFLEVKESIGYDKADQITMGGIRNKAISFTMVKNIFEGQERSPRVGNVYPPLGGTAGDVISTDPINPADEVPF